MSKNSLTERELKAIRNVVIKAIKDFSNSTPEQNARRIKRLTKAVNKGREASPKSQRTR